jgi:DNA-directed RNA polymerase specialized sigma24 family protein
MRTGAPSVDAGMALLPIGAVRDVLGYRGGEAIQVAVFIDDQRRYGRQPIKLVDASIAVEEEVASEPEPLAQALLDDTAKSLHNALAKLGEDHRIVVLLHDVEGYKLKEIQELTGIPVGTVKSRLHRGRERLRELLKKDGTFSVQDTCNSMNGEKIDAL